MSAVLDLGELHLTLAKSGLEVRSTTTASFTCAENQEETVAQHALDLRTLERSWVRRGCGLQVQVKVLAEGRPLGPAHLQRLASIICKAKLWRQLGLKASPGTSAEDPTECYINGTMTIALSYDAHTREQSNDTVHRLCYTIPATDVAPPASFRVLGLNVVRLELDIGRNTRKKKKKKKQRTQRETYQDDDCWVGKTDLPQFGISFEPMLTMAISEDVMLQDSLTDSGYESLFSTQTSHGDEADELSLKGIQNTIEDESDMLDVPADSTSSHVGTQSDTTQLAPTTGKVKRPRKRSASVSNASDKVESLVIPPDCITSLIDAVLRLSIEENPWRLRQGLCVRSNNIVSRLSAISPGLWTPGYLQEMSTRAPLLPTVAHALSHSIYTTAKSPTLKTKLQTLLYYGIDDDADGEVDEEMLISGQEEIAPKTRFELMSVMLWQVMQNRLHRPGAAGRLKNLTQGLEELGEAAENDEELILEIKTDVDLRNSNNILFDEDDEEGMMDYEDFDDEFLFEETKYMGRVAEGDEEDSMLLHDKMGKPGEEDEMDILLQDCTAAAGEEDDEDEDLFAECR